MKIPFISRREFKTRVDAIVSAGWENQQDILKLRREANAARRTQGLIIACLCIFLVLLALLTFDRKA